MNDLTVAIAAGGIGERLGLGPKGLLELAGAPLVSWVAGKARRVSDDVVVAVPAGSRARFAAHCPGCRCIDGGATRQESIARMARAAEREWLLLLDAASPFFSNALVDAVLAQARAAGVACACRPLDEPVAVLAGGWVERDYRRDVVGLFQTPQGYHRPLLLEVLAEAERRQWQEQSIMQLFVRAGRPIRAVAGERANIKVTTALDWRLAQLLADYLPGEPLRD